MVLVLDIYLHWQILLQQFIPIFPLSNFGCMNVVTLKNVQFLLCTLYGKKLCGGQNMFSRGNTVFIQKVKQKNW